MRWIWAVAGLTSSSGSMSLRRYLNTCNRWAWEKTSEYMEALYWVMLLQKMDCLPENLCLGQVIQLLISKEFDQDLSAYDEVVIGSPIWNARITPAINTVLASLNFSNKLVSFVFYSGSGTGKHAVKRINKEFPNAKIILLKQPKDYPDELNKIDL